MAREQVRPLTARHLLSSNWFQYPAAGLSQLFNPAKTPVVLIHGLLSTLRMWKPVIGSSSPTAKSDRYQFWFSSATGQPIPYSSKQPEALTEAASGRRCRIHSS